MANRIIFRQENKEDFKQYWNEYLNLNVGSPYYLLKTLDYFLAYSQYLVFDRSFVVVKGGKPVAGAFLPIEESAGLRSISIDQGFALAPVFEDRKNLASEIISLIEDIAWRDGVKKIMFRIDPLQNQKYPYNFLMNFDFLDVSLLGYLVDCKNPSMRRNHERAVKKLQGDPEFSVFIMDEKNKNREIHEQYRELHHKAAGKVTRKRETFDLQYQMLEEGNAILVGLKYRARFIAFTYFTFFQQGATSFSAADDPEFDKLPLYHIINAQALNYLKAKGIKDMDVDQPLTISQQFFHHPNEKQKNIALFKTGFGGKFVQDFRGVKYFSKGVFLRDANEFISKYQLSSYEK